MIIRILGIIGAILGILLLLSGIVGIFDISQLPNTAYYSGVKTATIFKIPLGLFFAFYGLKWAIRGYGEKKR
jgi:hypothetical protein